MVMTKRGRFKTLICCTFFILKASLCARFLALHVFSAHMLLKHGAVLQRLGGRAVLEDVVIETSQLLSYVLGTPPS